MKNIIKKILKEQDEEQPKFDPSKLESPEISISPRTQLEYAEKQYEWAAYIPEISRIIRFYLNPEEWNLSAKIRIEKVESRGHGSFGDDSHKDYQKSMLDIIYDDDDWGSEWWKGKIIGKDENYNFADVKDAINDIKGFSEEAERLTAEYKKQIQQITKQYVESIKPLREKYNFTNNDNQMVVTVDSKGNIKTEDDFKEDGKHWYGHERNYRSNFEKYKNRKI